MKKQTFENNVIIANCLKVQGFTRVNTESFLYDNKFIEGYKQYIVSEHLLAKQYGSYVTCTYSTIIDDITDEEYYANMLYINIPCTSEEVFMAFDIDVPTTLLNHAFIAGKVEEVVFALGKRNATLLEQTIRQMLKNLFNIE